MNGGGDSESLSWSLSESVEEKARDGGRESCECDDVGDADREVVGDGEELAAFIFGVCSSANKFSALDFIARNSEAI